MFPCVCYCRLVRENTRNNLVRVSFVCFSSSNTEQNTKYHCADYHKMMCTANKIHKMYFVTHGERTLYPILKCVTVLINRLRKITLLYLILLLKWNLLNTFNLMTEISFVVKSKFAVFSIVWNVIFMCVTPRLLSFVPEFDMCLNNLTFHIILFLEIFIYTHLKLS